MDEVGRKTAGLAPREDCEAAFVHMAGKDLEGEDDLLADGRHEACEADDTSRRGHTIEQQRVGWAWRWAQLSQCITRKRDIELDALIVRVFSKNG